MALFDSYVMVDWSARATPSPVRPAKDAIWIARACRDRPDTTRTSYVRTRAEALAYLCVLLRRERMAGRKVLVGFDFPFGYPKGVAARLTGTARALALWDWLEAELDDGPDNANNRYAVASKINRHFDGVGPCWGRPAAWDYPDIPAKERDRSRTGHPLERRLADQRAKGAKTVWQLAYAGSVGSQVLTGLPALNRLRRTAEIVADCAIWPFETGLAAPSAAITIAEIYPSLIPPDPIEAIKDAGQVRAVADWLGRLDRTGALAALFEGPPDLRPADRRVIEAEEAWILGLGSDHVSRGAARC